MFAKTINIMTPRYTCSLPFVLVTAGYFVYKLLFWSNVSVGIAPLERKRVNPQDAPGIPLQRAENDRPSA